MQLQQRGPAPVAVARPLCSLPALPGVSTHILPAPAGNPSHQTPRAASRQPGEDSGGILSPGPSTDLCTPQPPSSGIWQLFPFPTTSHGCNPIQPQKGLGAVLALRPGRALFPAPRPGGRCPGQLGQLLLSHRHPTARAKLALLPSLQPEEEHTHVFLHQLRGLHLRAGPDHIHHAHLQARPGEPCPSAPQGHAAGRASPATSVPGTPGKSRCSFGFTFPAPACALPSPKAPWVCLELSLQAESSTSAPKGGSRSTLRVLLLPCGVSRCVHSPQWVPRDAPGARGGAQEGAELWVNSATRAPCRQPGSRVAVGCCP